MNEKAQPCLLSSSIKDLLKDPSPGEQRRLRVGAHSSRHFTADLRLIRASDAAVNTVTVHHFTRQLSTSGAAPRTFLGSGRQSGGRSLRAANRHCGVIGGSFVT